MTFWPFRGEGACTFSFFADSISASEASTSRLMPKVRSILARKGRNVDGDFDAHDRGSAGVAGVDTFGT